MIRRLIGGALFHMIPAALIEMPAMTAGGWVALGFLILFVPRRWADRIYVASLQLDVRRLIPVAAGNFLYIGASEPRSASQQGTYLQGKRCALRGVRGRSGIAVRDRSHRERGFTLGC